MRQFVAFVVVGVLNTAFGYGVFAILYLLSGSYRLAIVLATGIGTMFNFYTTRRLVFKSQGRSSFIRFVVVYASICAINILFVDAATAEGVEALLAQLFALTFIVPISFVLNKWFVFGAAR